MRHVIAATCAPAGACTGQDTASFDGISAVDRTLRTGAGLSDADKATLGTWRAQLLTSLRNVTQARERALLERPRPLNGDVASSVLQYSSLAC